jgi:hypothetical protein
LECFIRHGPPPNTNVFPNDAPKDLPIFRYSQKSASEQRQCSYNFLVQANIGQPESSTEYFGATVLHYDSDFDHIAEVTRQPTGWIVPRGSVD